MSGTKIVNYVKSEQQVIENMTRLANDGYTLIMSTLSEHGTAVYTMVLAHPDTYFAQATPYNTSLPIPPNLFVMEWNAADMYFSLSTFADAVSRNGVIGFIHPGPPYGPIMCVNSFFMGVKSTRTNTSVHMVYTGTFLDPDLEKGATSILLDEIGADTILAQQDDFIVLQLLMERGILGVGTSGYLLSQVYRQDMGASLVYDWTRLFVVIVTLANKMIANRSYKPAPGEMEVD